MSVVRSIGHRWGVLLLLCTVLGITVAMAGPTTFVSDDFNAFNLKRPLWTLTDPRSDCTINLQGVNSGDARLYLTVPGGSSHDIWSDGNNAPRVLQNCANEDFTVEAKFESSLSGVAFSSYQAQGIMIQADVNNFIRFDLTTGNRDSTKAFSAVFAGGLTNPQVKIDRGISRYGVAPLWLRVNRTGNVFTMMTSKDGVIFDTMGTFTHGLAVTKVGLYTINAGTNAQTFTMIADYFFNSDSPIDPEDGATNVTDTQGPLVHGVRFRPGPNAIQILWRTDEPANGTVDYGTTPSYGTTLFLSPLVTDHRLTVGGLASGVQYNFRISGTDGTSHSDQSGNFTSTTTAYVQDSASVSEDFRGSALDGALWTFLNPRGDAAASVAGGQLSLEVPGGIAHEPYTSGNTAPRVVQPFNPAANVGEYTVKFNSLPSGPTTTIPMQGMYFEQDSVNFIRTDIYSYGTTIYVYAASFTDGLTNVDAHINVAVPVSSAPVWLRVNRGGALWRVYYSTDGSSWAQAGAFFKVISLTKAGIFAGNAGTSPQAFTCQAEYFQAMCPAKPFLVSPAAAASNVPRPVVFIWDSATAATTYRLQASTSPSFLTTAFDSIVAGTSRVVSVLQPTTQYHWRVRGLNGGFTGPYSASRNFITGINSPSAPSLVSPADNATEISITPTLIWTKPATATSYRLQIGTESTFAGGIAIDDSTVTDTVTTTAALVYNTRYFWRVAAKNSGGYSAYSAVRRFITRLATPPPPTLLSPANGAPDQPVSPSLTWNASEGASGYWIQVDTDNQFAAPFILDDSTVTATSRTVSGLAHSTTYYWRVHSKNTGGSSAPSEVWSFTTAIEPPAQPTLVAPANGATGQLSSLMFIWTRAARAATFRLQVGTDSTFLTGLLFNDSTLTDTLGIVGPLAYGQKYFWRVTPKNAGGTGPSSEIFSFFTLAADPLVPVQIAPANGSTITEQTVTLRWTAPVGASSFHVQVATDPTFASGIVFDDPAVLDTTRTVSGLTYMTTYYWRVNADNIGGVSPWSPTASFLVRVPLPAAVALLAPGHNVVTSAANTLTAWFSSSPLVDRYQIDLAADSLFTFRISDSTVTDTTKMYTSLIDNQRYFWRVRAHNVGGWGPYSEVRAFNASVNVGVEKEPELPTTISLSQNYPNPFNPSTQIQFGLPEATHVTLEVYNLIGERVATLVNETMSVGYHTVRFDASNLSTGLYIYRMVAGTKTIVHKMMLVK